MTKYKTDADKLRFIREAREARIPKARIGRIMFAPTTKGEISDSLESQGQNPDFIYTNTTQGQTSPGIQDTTTFGNTTQGKINNRLHREMWLKSQSKKRK